MGVLLKYLRLLAVQFRISLLLLMQYRLEFFFEGLLSLLWILASLVPLFVLFGHRTSVAGWSWHQALVVVAWFTCLKAVLDGAIQPSLQAIVEHIRRGTLDFLLLKPADAQFLISTARFEFSKIADVLAGLCILVYALHGLGHVPSAKAILMTLALLFAALCLIYSIGILVVSLAFHVVKVDNLFFLFSSIYDAARWPASIFRGALYVVFTFIIPLTMMTTYPALAIMDRLAAYRVAFAFIGAFIFFGMARLVWKRAVTKYTSAGG